MISELSKRVQHFVSVHEKSFPGTAGFVSAVAEARRAVDTGSPDLSFTFHLKVNLETMGDNPNIGFARLLGEIEGWMGFIVHSVTFRLGHFLDDIVTGLNDARPYRAMNATRSLVELSAYVYHHTKILSSATADLSSALGSEKVNGSSQANPDFPSVLNKLLSTLKLATHFAQSSRFNWGAMVRGDMDAFFSEWGTVEEHVKARQIMTLIDKLPGEEKRSARFFYEMLCDYVHPNLGANTLLVNRAEPVPVERMRWELSREPNSDEALFILFHSVAIPVRASLQTMLKDLQQLEEAKRWFGEWKRHCENIN